MEPLTVDQIGKLSPRLCEKCNSRRARDGSYVCRECLKNISEDVLSNLDISPFARGYQFYIQGRDGDREKHNVEFDAKYLKDTEVFDD